jgi:hypothetical protein
MSSSPLIGRTATSRNITGEIVAVGQWAGDGSAEVVAYLIQTDGGITTVSLDGLQVAPDASTHHATLRRTLTEAARAFVARIDAAVLFDEDLEAYADLRAALDAEA